jgi:hypothetical protein
MGITRKNARGIPWQLLEKRDTVKHTGIYYANGCWRNVYGVMAGQCLPRFHDYGALPEERR